MSNLPSDIRVATPGDAPLFVSIVRRAFEETRAFPQPSSALLESEAEVRAALEQDGGLIALLDADAVGCVRVHISGADTKLEQIDRTRCVPTGPRIGVRVFFSRLAVVPGARRRGVASALLAAVLDYARAIGAESVDMTARSQQPDNRPFWGRRGFVVTGYSDRYGIADMVTHMRRPLSYALMESK